MLVANAVVDTDQPRLQVGENQMDDRQVLLGNLWITTLGNSEVLIAALTEASIAAPIVSNDQRSRRDGALDEPTERLGATVEHDGEPNGFAPATIVTDKLRSYGTAIRLLALSAQGLRKNNRAENSHQPVRRRERKMQRFKSPASAQRFLAVHATVYNLFNVQRHLVSRRTLRQFRGDAMRQWRQVTTVA